jgi:hypothetical protein
VQPISGENVILLQRGASVKMSQISSRFARMKAVGIFALLWLTADIAAAKDIPLPRARPADRAIAAAPQPEVAPPMEVTDSPPPAPSACRLRLTAELAIAPTAPPMTGPGECGGPDLVSLEAVVLPDNKGKVALNPPMIVRCGMAEAIVGWIRDFAPAAAELGSQLKALQGASYECRTRNRVAGAKLSEHGRANALDVLKVKLANGRVIDPTDATAPKDFRASMRQSACARFTTVLGPGSDPSHENHLHVDLAERRSGYRMCQWDVREPAPVKVAALVPLPPPRPKIEETVTEGKRGRRERNATR